MKDIKWKKSSGKTFLDATRQNCLAAMSQIDNISNNKWHFYRKLLNQFDFESRQVAVNRAFYKLWEIIGNNKNNLIHNTNDPLTTLHLAEAPGSFVQVVKELFPKCQSIAISRPPSSYAQVVAKSKTIPVFSPTVMKLDKVEFLYIDLLHKQMLEALVDILRKRTLFKNGFDFITADGGFDEEEQYDMKEILHFNLILSEVVSILLLQSIGGTCVVKILETFTETTFHLMWLLCQHYDTYEFVKPVTSRPTNAEKYIICKGFKGKIYTDNSLLELTNLQHISKNYILSTEIPPHFISYMCEISDKFSKNQIDTINNVINIVGKTGHKQYIDKSSYNEMKRQSFNEWCKQYCFNPKFT